MILINHELKALCILLPNCGFKYIYNILTTFYGFSNIETVERNDITDFFNTDEELINSLEFYKGSIFSIKKMGIFRFIVDNEDNNMINDITNDMWKNYFKFTFVRNPYDRYISGYISLKNRAFPDDTISNLDINSLLHNCDKVGNGKFFKIFINQFDHLIDYNNELNMQFIGDVENLDSNLIKVLNILGIKNFKHLDSENYDSNSFFKMFYIDRSKTNYDLLTNEIVLKINDVFENDFKYFNFKKFYSKNELIEHDYNTINIFDTYVKTKKLKLNIKSDSLILNNLTRLVNNFFDNIYLIYDIQENNEYIKNQKAIILNEFNKLENNDENLYQSTNVYNNLCDSLIINSEFNKIETYNCSKCNFMCYSKLTLNSHYLFCNK